MPHPRIPPVTASRSAPAHGASACDRLRHETEAFASAAATDGLLQSSNRRNANVIQDAGSRFDTAETGKPSRINRHDANFGRVNSELSDGPFCAPAPCELQGGKGQLPGHSNDPADIGKWQIDRRANADGAAGAAGDGDRPDAAAAGWGRGGEEVEPLVDALTARAKAQRHFEAARAILTERAAYYDAREAGRGAPRSAR